MTDGQVAAVVDICGRISATALSGRGVGQDRSRMRGASSTGAAALAAIATVTGFLVPRVEVITDRGEAD